MPPVYSINFLTPDPVHSLNVLTPHQHTCQQLSSTPVYKPVTHYTSHPVAVAKELQLKRPASIWIRSCSIAHQIHVVFMHSLPVYEAACVFMLYAHGSYTW